MSRLQVLLSCAGLAVTPAVFGQLSEPFPAELDLVNLDGEIGFRVVGATSYDLCGSAVASAGDVNGDGLTDLLVGAQLSDIGGDPRGGAAYLIYGRGGVWPADIFVGTLSRDEGITMPGEPEPGQAGDAAIGIGDINGDGIDDFAVGARVMRGSAGNVYVIFGRDGSEPFPASLPLGEVSGATGFRVLGPDGSSFGEALGHADLNHDGRQDLIVGAARASRAAGGAVYVIYGRSDSDPFPDELEAESLDGSDGFVMFDTERFGYAGSSVAGLGDVNGDGVDDVAIGAPGYADPGICFVVFGRRGGLPPEVELSQLDGTGGFWIRGGFKESVGKSVANAGDVNGDGVNDIAMIASGYTGYSYCYCQVKGRAYVVFGRDDGDPFPAVLDVQDLDGTQGFRFGGPELASLSNLKGIAGVDINGDGLGDVVVGDSVASPVDRERAGEVRVVFGRPTTEPFPALVRFTDLDGTIGFRILGAREFAYAGGRVASAGDINGDGVEDLALGAPSAFVFGPGQGEASIIFGRGGDRCRADLDGDGQLTIFDFLAFQNAFAAGDLIADFDGDGGLTIFDFLAFQNEFDAGCE